MSFSYIFGMFALRHASNVDAFSSSYRADFVYAGDTTLSGSATLQSAGEEFEGRLYADMIVFMLAKPSFYKHGVILETQPRLIRPVMNRSFEKWCPFPATQLCQPVLYAVGHIIALSTCISIGSPVMWFDLDVTDWKIRGSRSSIVHCLSIGAAVAVSGPVIGLLPNGLQQFEAWSMDTWPSSLIVHLFIVRPVACWEFACRVAITVRDRCPPPWYPSVLPPEAWHPQTPYLFFPRGELEESDKACTHVERKEISGQRLIREYVVKGMRVRR
ncbi:hypothetical protein CONPUDRAFT_76048 [Coniophora puteana RWD-64-598 SS2]|uniref:Uncharacterized protein n=1 Tax=Coniophora puteana (strain RWD-64-598) TaxID=741705 RepID=A0A5M3MDI3_CONPW|nr:uncharacterized protein CONPUDRAFT_76048 [Coniophora puteana RWD-64-598 SS2]EIW77288.1 hypothetical protein CONPUDRAFT_76048 [Coniophora puteana RWD-64-598 SS2]